VGAHGQGERAPGGGAIAHAVRRRRRGIALAILAAALFLILAALPARPKRAAGGDPGLAQRTVGGAFHVHTTRSDGSAGNAAVAAAARRAGLQFVVFTDHGDGTRGADPPQYLDGVLCLDGVEISTNGGHYVALDAAVSPYPLGGESAAVVEDVARLGGFGVAAHPESPRAELAWADWSLPVDGVEWLNADSEWRDEGRWRIGRALAAYPLRPAGALAMLLDRPEATLARWDNVASRRRVLAIAGHDAHGGVRGRIEDGQRGRTIPVPSYESSFRTFSTRVVLARPFTADARADGAALLDAMRAGSFYTQVDAIAVGSSLEFQARAGQETVGQGGVLRAAGMATFSATAAVPEDTRIVAFRNGVRVGEASGGGLRFDSADAGSFRVEVHVAGAPGDPPVPWLVSNPIFRLPEVAAQPSPARPVVLPLRNATWRIEKETSSQGAARTEAAGGGVAFDYRLGAGEPANQFAALVTDLPRAVPPFGAVTFVADAPRPSRISVQLRFASDGDVRWVKSVYVDSARRPITVAIDEMRPAEGVASRPDVSRATSLLFVVDLTNAKPGDEGTLGLRNIALAK
jgi:hypothetical protein